MPTLRNRRRQINAIFVLKVLQLAYGQRDCTKQSASAKKTSVSASFHMNSGPRVPGMVFLRETAVPHMYSHCGNGEVYSAPITAGDTRRPG